MSGHHCVSRQFGAGLFLLMTCTSVTVAQRSLAPGASGVSDLPLIEAPAKPSSVTLPGSSTLVVFLTGDGGWATLDREVSKELVRQGASVVGFNSREYIEHKHSPDELATDVGRVIRYYMMHWNRPKVAIVGYSRGADLAPFAVTRLPEDLRSRVQLLALLGVSNHANFHFHLVDFIRAVRRPSDVLTLPELKRLEGLNMLCVYGSDEDDSACRDAPPGLTKRVERAGGHHFGSGFDVLAQLIISALPH